MYPTSNYLHFPEAREPQPTLGSCSKVQLIVGSELVTVYTLSNRRHCFRRDHFQQGHVVEVASIM